LPPAERAAVDLERAARREGRRLALAAVFEAEFGQRTATAVLERRLIDEPATGSTADHARQLVAIVVEQRVSLDALISEYAPQYPVGQLARVDRALLRLGLGELLHCPTTPARLAIAEWVELARTYSGEPARRLINGVLGRVAREATGHGR
jgi:transcription antitermination protein NusB